jgi:DNA polymerase-3 subunit epsilon
VTRIIVFDVESTGKERGTDQIIELCIQHDLVMDAKSITWRIKPSVAIHPEALVVHGITAEDLAGCPMFDAVAPDFLPLFEAADMIVGYNIAFDLDMLQAELSRSGFPPLDLSRKLLVDVLRLWHHVEPRTLVAAHEKFCGTLLIDAHQSRTDVVATARVLTSMLEVFGLAGKTWSEIAAISDPFPKRFSWLGPSSHIQWDASGAAVFGFGKYKGTQVDQVDGGFLRWVLSKDFPPHVKDICREAFERHGQFNDWITKHYPRPVKAQPADGLDVPFGQADLPLSLEGTL